MDTFGTERVLELEARNRELSESVSQQDKRLVALGQSLRERCDRIDDNVAGVRERCDRIDDNVAGVARKADACADRLQELNSRESDCSLRLATLESDCSEDSKEIRRKIRRIQQGRPQPTPRELNQINKRLQDLTESRGAITSKLSVIESEIGQLDQNVGVHQEVLDDLVPRHQTLVSRVKDLEALVEGCRLRLRSLEADRSPVDQEIARRPDAQIKRRLSKCLAEIEGIAQDLEDRIIQ